MCQGVAKAPRFCQVKCVCGRILLQPERIRSHACASARTSLVVPNDVKAALQCRAAVRYARQASHSHAWTGAADVDISYARCRDQDGWRICYRSDLDSVLDKRWGYLMADARTE